MSPSLVDLVFRNESWWQFLDGVRVSTTFIGLYLNAGFNIFWMLGRMHSLTKANDFQVGVFYFHLITV